MKKLISIIFILLSFTIFSACEANLQSRDSANVKLGVIETTGYKSKSYIHFYDEDLNFLYKEEINYASLSEPFDRPICENGEVYIIPKGEFEKRKETYILNYNINSNEYKLYDTQITSMNRLAVSNEYIFGVNCINGNSNIVRCLKSDPSEIITVEFKNIYIAELFVQNEKVYAIMHNEDAKIIFAELSINTLETIGQYDITSYGSPCTLLDYKEKIYFANQYEEEAFGTLSSKLTVFDKNKKVFEQIELNEYSPNNLIINNDLLFISHYDRVQNQGNQITVINLDTGAMEAYKFKHPIKQISADDKYIYILGESCIYKYIFNNEQFQQINHTEINADKSNTFYYITSFFVNN